MKQSAFAQRHAWYNPFAPYSIAPLVTFRILFGAAMTLGVVRFLLLGWVDVQYVKPTVHFAYYGCEWVPRLHDALQAATNGWSIYAMFALMLVAALGITLGAWYRASAVAYFLTFSYVELIDKTYYLNHYYFVSLVALLMTVLPAERECSLDVWRKPALRLSSVPRWTVDILKFQVAVVYVYAGFAKMQSEWLFRAMPLAIWLPANDTLPLIGVWLRERWVAYAFSWAGMLYDTTIVGWLIYHKTRVVAYLAVIVFHVLTGLMFQIGVFPLVMIALTPVFFSVPFHERSVTALKTALKRSAKFVSARFEQPAQPPQQVSQARSLVGQRMILAALAVYVTVQIVLPWRWLLYQDHISYKQLFWTEEGYRFGWRVMLMEKAGTATLYVKDNSTGKEGEVVNREFLNEHQEKQMAMQPDMLLQFAQYLREYYAARGVHEPSVRAEVYVTLNGEPSRLYLDSTTNLAAERDSWQPKRWILPMHK